MDKRPRTTEHAAASLAHFAASAVSAATIDDLLDRMLSALTELTGAVSATVVTITDPVPANTTFANNVYSGNTRNVSITVGATTTFCQAEAGGTDTNTDGCFLTAGGVLTVGAPALATVATGAGNAVTVRFRVTID